MLQVKQGDMEASIAERLGIAVTNLTDTQREAGIEKGVLVQEPLPGRHLSFARNAALGG